MDFRQSPSSCRLADRAASFGSPLPRFSSRQPFPSPSSHWGIGLILMGSIARSLPESSEHDPGLAANGNCPAVGGSRAAPTGVSRPATFTQAIDDGRSGPTSRRLRRAIETGGVGFWSGREAQRPARQGPFRPPEKTGRNGDEFGLCARGRNGLVRRPTGASFGSGNI